MDQDSISFSGKTETSPVVKEHEQIVHIVKRGRPPIKRFEADEIEMGKHISVSIIARVAKVALSIVGTREWDLARLRVRLFVRKEFKRIYGCKCFVQNDGDGLVIVPADGTYAKACHRVKKALRSNRETASVCADVATKLSLSSQEERVKLSNLASSLAVVNNSVEMRDVRSNLWRGINALPKLRPHDFSKDANNG